MKNREKISILVVYGPNEELTVVTQNTTGKIYETGDFNERVGKIDQMYTHALNRKTRRKDYK